MGKGFTTLLQHIDATLLRQAYYWLKRDASRGVDGMTWDAYGEGRAARLSALESRIHLGSYRAQPSLRAYIPKPDIRQRPLGVAALEDRIVQRAVVEVLNAIYEQDFLGLSYGFRPSRGQHDALDALAVDIGERAVNWVLDADIKGFFDNISHDWMMRFVEHRVGDRRVFRLIRGWLKAGVVEDGVRQRGDEGLTLKKSVAEQGAWLGSVVWGFFFYHAVPTKTHSFGIPSSCCRPLATRLAPAQPKGLDDGGQAGKPLAPRSRISHPWPSQRFRVKHPRWEPYAGMPLVRFRAGALGHGRPYRDLGPVDNHLRARTVLARWIIAAKLSSVLS
jgi:hypothetical protein